MLLVAGGAHGQGATGPDGASDATIAPGVANNYTFPDNKQQLHNFASSAFGPLAFVRSAIGAGIDESKPAPPEWDSGAEGYGERYGFRFGMFLIAETSRYSLGAVMREDVAYHRCECNGFLPRSAHALASTFTARTHSGRTVFSIPALVAPYAGSFSAVNAWYPARYEPMDAARLGTLSFSLQVGGNMLREFLPHRR